MAKKGQKIKAKRKAKRYRNRVKAARKAAKHGARGKAKRGLAGLKTVPVTRKGKVPTLVCDGGRCRWVYE